MPVASSRGGGFLRPSSALPSRFGVPPDSFNIAQSQGQQGVLAGD